MSNTHQFQSVPDDQLLQRLSELLQSSRDVEAELIAHIAEVDQRRLYQRHASSMFKYATEVLHLSEAETYLRIEVARASRKHPMLLEMLADGRLHLSGIAVLAPILTEANRETVLARAVHKTKKEIKELVAELAPKPDVPDSIRKLPERRETTETGATTSPSLELRPDGVDAGAATPTAPAPTPLPAKPAETEPLSPSRYKVAFTASAELRDKLERLQALMRSSGNDGDLASVIEAAVTEKLEKLEAKRYGKTKTPRKSLEETDTTPSSRYIPTPVKRAVFERDSGQCVYVDETGRRCTETARLEFHHLKPYGQGGDHSPDNVELRCHTHNWLQAELDYGKELMDLYRSSGQVSEPAAIYTFSNRFIF
jgi:5-methylcytosine-specific restriction endonuclease McrA